MEKEKYTVENITNILNKTQGIKISKSIIKIEKNSNFGIKTLGKIDFLTKNGYSIEYIDSLSTKKAPKDNKDDFEEPKRKKKKKGIDIISGVKTVIKMSNLKVKK